MIEYESNTVFENDIERLIYEYFNTDQEEEIRKASQQRWNCCLMYICKKLFKNTPVLKRKDNNNLHNEYDYIVCNTLCDIYIYYCMMFEKIVSINGFCYLSGIDQYTINLWGSDPKKTSDSTLDIHKKLMLNQEEAVVSKLYDNKANSIGLIAALNHYHGWDSPYVKPTHENKTLSSTDLPWLVDKN